MATARKSSTKSAPAEEVEVEATASEPTFKQIANAAIDEAARQLGVEAKNRRYKVQRAFGFIAIQLASEAGELDELIASVVDGAGDLPPGFGLGRSVAATPVPKAKATAKPVALKAAPAKTTPKATTARKRHARKRHAR